MIEVKIWHKSTPNENRDYFMNNDILNCCQFRKKMYFKTYIQMEDIGCAKLEFMGTCKTIICIKIHL